jgi:hypothetical protein
MALPFLRPEPETLTMTTATRKHRHVTCGGTTYHITDSQLSIRAWSISLSDGQVLADPWYPSLYAAFRMIKDRHPVGAPFKCVILNG